MMADSDVTVTSEMIADVNVTDVAVE